MLVITLFSRYNEPISGTILSASSSRLFQAARWSCAVPLVSSATVGPSLVRLPPGGDGAVADGHRWAPGERTVMARPSQYRNQMAHGGASLVNSGARRRKAKRWSTLGTCGMRHTGPGTTPPPPRTRASRPTRQGGDRHAENLPRVGNPTLTPRSGQGLGCSESHHSADAPRDPPRRFPNRVRTS
ncbi:hypothetical protein CITRIK5_30063 [Citricoccus sp. K5]|nr:hypothetical protein CITRIK5_30063 [Citricoccus sp. K5]